MDSQIQQFYENQTVFITGGTGFLGKLLIEKLLRSTNCKCIHLLIREKKGRSTKDRLNQLFDNALFDRLKNERPHFKNRIHLINGDCMLDNLGLQSADELVLAKSVNIVFHVAATVRLNEDLKVAYLINVSATGDVIRLCKKMDHLKSVVHVSTSYLHSQRDKLDEYIYDMPTDHRQLSDLLGKLQENEIKALTDKIIGDWPNTYTFTKALAEDLIKKEAAHQQHFPIGVFRPAIIISTYKQPIPGWVDNLYGITGFITGSLLGLVRLVGIDGGSFGDVVPGDYCADALIAIGWGLATRQKSNNQPIIYNYVSSIDNPITWDEFMDLSNLNALHYPSNKAMWLPRIKTVNDTKALHFLQMILHTIPGLFLEFIALLSGRRGKIWKAYQRLHAFNDLVINLRMRNWEFSNNNLKQLLGKLNAKDRELFEFDMKDVQWLIYFRSYIKGIRVYLLNDPLETLDDAKHRLWWFNNANLLLIFLLNISVFVLLYFVFVTIFC